MIGVLYAVLDLVAHVLIWAGFVGALGLALLALYRPDAVPR